MGLPHSTTLARGITGYSYREVWSAASAALTSVGWSNLAIFDN